MTTTTMMMIGIGNNGGSGVGNNGDDTKKRLKVTPEMELTPRSEILSNFTNWLFWL